MDLLDHADRNLSVILVYGSRANDKITLCRPEANPCKHVLTAKSRANTLMPCCMSTCSASSESRRLPLLQWQ